MGDLSELSTTRKRGRPTKPKVEKQEFEVYEIEKLRESKVGLSEEELLRRKIERAQRTLDSLNVKLYGVAS